MEYSRNGIPSTSFTIYGAHPARGGLCWEAEAMGDWLKSSMWRYVKQQTLRLLWTPWNLDNVQQKGQTTRQKYNKFEQGDSSGPKLSESSYWFTAVRAQVHGVSASKVVCCSRYKLNRENKKDNIIKHRNQSVLNWIIKLIMFFLMHVWLIDSIYFNNHIGIIVKHLWVFNEAQRKLSFS